MSDRTSVAPEDIREPSGSGTAQMLNKRPCPGLCSDSRPLVEMDGAGGVPLAAAAAAGTLSSMRRRQLTESLLHWQESQVEAARDNILNTVLEHFLTYFHQRNSRNGGDEPANDNAVQSVQSEAIRMAISRTGLQTAGPSGASSVFVPVSVAAEERRAQPEPSGSWQDPGRLLPDNYILDTAVAAAIQEKGLVTCDAEATDSDDSMLQEDGAR